MTMIDVPPTSTVDWTATDERGACGTTYEVTLTLNLPYEADAHDLRNEIIDLAARRGARNPATRLIALGPLSK